MTASLSAYGFEEVGAFEGPCWNQENLCSFKATGQDYARMDYVFLLKRNQSIQSTVVLEKPFIDKKYLLTDHYTMKADFNW